MAMCLVVIDRGERELPQVALALGPPGRLSGCLNRGNEQRHEETDDEDHHEELDEGKTFPDC
jgi:hypothetical protein